MCRLALLALVTLVLAWPLCATAEPPGERLPETPERAAEATSEPESGVNTAAGESGRTDAGEVPAEIPGPPQPEGPRCAETPAEGSEGSSMTLRGGMRGPLPFIELEIKLGGVISCEAASTQGAGQALVTSSTLIAEGVDDPGPGSPAPRPVAAGAEAAPEQEAASEQETDPRSGRREPSPDRS